MPKSRRPISLGCEGLDGILGGGLPGRHLYLLKGGSGTGKTTLALQFLLAGLEAGETVMYVSLSQTRGELEQIAASHGWSLDGVVIEDLEASAENQDAFAQTVLQTADIQLDRTRDAIEEALRREKPDRLVYDSLLEMRHLSQDVCRYRRELLGLKSFMAEREIATLVVDTLNGDGTSDAELENIVHGIVHLDKTLPEYGAARRRLEIAKMRGVAFPDGWHDMAIRRPGVAVFPRVVPDIGEPDSERPDIERPDIDRAGIGEATARRLIESGVERLDAMLGGGMEAGTTTILTGQAGTGKSTLSSLYAHAALERGEAASVFLFEERRSTFFRRCEGLGLDMRRHEANGRLALYDVTPTEISPGELARIVRRDMDERRVTVVVIDSFTGYLSALPHGGEAVVQLQSLLNYLTRRGVLVIMTIAQRGLLNERDGTNVDVSFLGDTILLTRLHEDRPRLTRSIAAVKKRHGRHDMAVYELGISGRGVEVGPMVAV